jgi:hypothetical protein
MTDSLIFGTTNIDTVSPTSNNTIFAGGGNDLIDLSQSSGNNRVYGGSGNDQIIANINDTIFGGDDDDQLFIGNGNNIISGGQGNDLFWLVENGNIPENQLTTITDFTLNTDKIIIDNVTGISSINDLTLVSQENGTLIKIGQENLAVLLGVNKDNLTNSDFVFENSPPILTANLANDTGVSNTDKNTYDPTITGNLIESNLASLKAKLNNNTIDLSLNNDGSFSVTKEKLTELNGGTLPDGSYNLQLIASDITGNTSEINVNFTLDTTGPNLTANLANDTGVSNTDKNTYDPTITGNLIESNLASLKAKLNNNTIDLSLNNDGSFSVTKEKLTELNGGTLPDGSYNLQLIASDITGNTSEINVNFTLDTIAPSLNITSPSIKLSNFTPDLSIENSPIDPTIVNLASKEWGIGNITGNVTNFTSINYQLNNGNPITITVNENGEFSEPLALQGLENTYPNLTITATDLAGNIITDNRNLGVILTTETGLGYLDVTVGNGASPTLENSVTVHYTGTFTNGEVFDSSRNRGQTSTFSMTGVISGFQEGIDSMNIGGRRILFIPSNLGYNDGTLRIFDVELFGIS